VPGRMKWSLKLPEQEWRRRACGRLSGWYMLLTVPMVSQMKPQRKSSY